jgi:hypothetical protein
MNLLNKNVFSFLFILIILSFNYFGCSSATTEGYKQHMQLWVGHDINELMSSWGIPGDEYNMPNGNKLYSYLWIGGSYVSVNYNYYLSSVRASKTTYWCKTTFTVDKNGKILQVSWEGNSCVAEELEK